MFHICPNNSDRESSGVFFKETNTVHRSSIRMFPKNAPPLNLLVKSLRTLNIPQEVANLQQAQRIKGSWVRVVQNDGSECKKAIEF